MQGCRSWHTNMTRANLASDVASPPMDLFARRFPSLAFLALHPAVLLKSRCECLLFYAPPAWSAGQ